jgi:ATP-dependent Clp protease adaptor protein ClpS
LYIISNDFIYFYKVCKKCKKEEILPKLDLDEELDISLCEPKKFKVIILNDDYTSQDFVVYILTTILNKTYKEAFELMMKIHNEGKAICGVYVYDIAQTKVHQIESIARDNDFPLRALCESE